MSSSSALNVAVDRPALAHALLAPASVAIVGASDDAGKTSGRPLRFLRAAGFQGRVYPVNARRATVQGETAYPTLTALPEVPEHVFILTPTEGVLDAVSECAELGVKVATILAGGFAEAGPEGAAREQALLTAVQGSGVRLLGPNSLGLVRPSTGLLLTANAAFAEPEIPAGKVFVASHSGSMIGALVSRGKARGLGFAGLVSVGSELDLSLGEICAATLDDPGIEGYLLFLESLKHGAQLREFALQAARRGKPVIAYKLGRSAAAAEMAATHTGALAGEDDVADAFFKGLGIIRVDMIETLLETFPLARRLACARVQPGRKRVGVVTTTGGGAAMAVDQLGVRGVVVEPPSAQTLARLAAAGVPSQPGRVLDLTLAGTRYEVMKAALDILLEAPEFDLVLAVVGSSARFQPDLAVKPILDSANAARPLAAMLVPDAPIALAQLTAAQVPCFRTPEVCADALAAVLARAEPSAVSQLALPSAKRSRYLSERRAYEVLDRLGIPRAATDTVPLAGELPDLPFDFPLVAKLCSEEIPHKTEIGGVILNIADKVSLQEAMATLRENLARNAPGVSCDEVLLQPMCTGLAEVLIGYRIDPDAGPLVMLAAGGIWAEVMRDRSLRLAPVTRDAALQMIDEVVSLRTVTGLRGRTKGDLEALADAIVALSKLAEYPELSIVEAEVNPMLILPQGRGVLAVDALVVQS